MFGVKYQIVCYGWMSHYNIIVSLLIFSMYYTMSFAKTCIISSIILGFHPVTASLAHRANHRLQQAYCKSTMSAYLQKFKIFVSFCVFSQVPLQDLSPVFILAFLEFLVFNNFTYSAVVNAISAIKSKLSSFGISTASFNDRRVIMFLQITQVCDTMSQGYVFKAVYLFEIRNIRSVVRLIMLPYIIDVQ